MKVDICIKSPSSIAYVIPRRCVYVGFIVDPAGAMPIDSLGLAKGHPRIWNIQRFRYAQHVCIVELGMPAVHTYNQHTGNRELSRPSCRRSRRRHHWCLGKWEVWIRFVAWCRTAPKPAPLSNRPLRLKRQEHHVLHQLPFVNLANRARALYF